MNEIIFATKQKIGLSDCATRITRCFSDTVANFVKVGYYLSYIDHNFKFSKAVDGFASFDDFCKCTYNLSRRSVKRFIDIFTEFGKKDSEGRYLCSIADEYKNYSCSQLAEMLSLSDSQKALASADMTVKQIRSLKGDTEEKEEKEEIVDSDCEELGDVAQPENIDSFDMNFTLNKKGELQIEGKLFTDGEKWIVNLLKDNYTVKLHISK